MNKQWEAMITALGEAVTHSVQALRQSTALTEVLIAKGVLTKAEIDEAMHSTQELTMRLEALLVQMEEPPADDD